MNSIFSLNIRGMGDPSKQLRLQDMFSEIHPCVVPFQEILCSRSKAIGILLSILPGWHAAGVDSVGKDGGMMAISNPSMFTF